MTGWGEACLCGEDDGEVIQGEGCGHSLRCRGGEVGSAKGDVWGCDTEVSMMRNVGVLMCVI